MKKFSFLILSLIMIYSSQAFAENKPSESSKPDAKPKDRFEMMATRLQLDEKQKKALKPVFENLKKQREDALAQLDQNEQKELSKILNPQQTQQVQRALKMGAQRGQKAGTGYGKREYKGEKSKGPYPRPPQKLDKPTNNQAKN